MDYTTVPTRDISPEQARHLIGEVVTQKVYDDPEATEPNATVTGRLLVLATNAEFTLTVFEGNGSPSPLDASEVSTITFASERRV